MARRYDSFTVRCWRLDSDAWRIEIEHLQSAGRARVPSLVEAIDWITIQCGATATLCAAQGSACSSAQMEVMTGEGEKTDASPMD